MKRRHLRPALAGLVTFVLVVTIGVLLFGDLGGDGAGAAAEAPADRATLQHIAEKNDDAATTAAARMRADSRRSDIAADALAENRLPPQPPTVPAPQ